MTDKEIREANWVTLLKVKHAKQSLMMSVGHLNALDEDSRRALGYAEQELNIAQGALENALAKVEERLNNEQLS